jgi:hypothetical protein
LKGEIKKNTLTKREKNKKIRTKLKKIIYNKSGLGVKIENQ